MGTHPLTLKEIQSVTGHENTDAIRMALSRAKVTGGIVFGTSYWPPKKTYDSDKVWKLFGPRITKRAEEDEEVRALCLRFFEDEIRSAVTDHQTVKIFGSQTD